MTIMNRDDVESVGKFKIARCDECDAQYGVHADGACPQCGTEMEMTPNYSGMLAMGYEGIVRQLARDHAGYGFVSVCSMCTENTPLAYENASDGPKVSVFEDTVADAEAAIDQLGEDTTWVRGELADAYTEAYHDELDGPETCYMCHMARAEEEVECGHTRAGETCPVAEN